MGEVTSPKTGADFLGMPTAGAGTSRCEHAITVGNAIMLILNDAQQCGLDMRVSDRLRRFGTRLSVREYSWHVALLGHSCFSGLLFMWVDSHSMGMAGRRPYCVMRS